MKHALATIAAALLGLLMWAIIIFAVIAVFTPTNDQDASEGPGVEREVEDHEDDWDDYDRDPLGRGG